MSDLLTYALAYPADLVFPVYALVFELGVDIDQVETRIHKVLQSIGHGETVEHFFHYLHSQLETLPRPKPNPSGITLLYGGMTIANNPVGRLVDDLLSNYRRFSNFNLANANTIRWYDLSIPILDIPVQSTLDYRTNRTLGDVESILIDAMHRSSLNSARGGWLPDFQPSLDCVEVVHTVVRVVGAKDITAEEFLGFAGGIQDEDTGKVFQVERHILSRLQDDLDL
ncbi:hypothetical protein JAAARDRAFT_196011 [Jaapia argillacea MUCL 33604]|uniref:Uncharacterized protein n=1 Tax=Jaapia argillacea MUCL 33604 TaxID=933084 RepID=A0A067PJR4_9AGAM|nr:hypothetical protein JAAARDRAFT_196011 [Jaapia argillacea MUCL 33604]